MDHKNNLKNPACTDPVPRHGCWWMVLFFQTRQRRSDQMKKISERDGKQPMTGTPKNDDRFCGCHCANPGAPCWFMTNVYFCSKNWASWAWIGCRFHSKMNNWLVVWNMCYFPYNVKLGLINPAVFINPLCPFFCNFKTGGPTGLVNRLAKTWLINHQCWNPILFYFPNLFIFKWFLYSILKLKPHEHQNPSLLIIENLKKTAYSQNDRCLIKLSIKISSFDSSPRVPPWAHVPH